MKITVHRGADQIGGCITEYESNRWRIFVDYGDELLGSQQSDKPLTIEGLTHGDISKSALLITHYHGDHIGKICELPDDLPIYIGKTCRDIHVTYLEHLRSVNEASDATIERLKKANIFTPSEKFRFGTFSIMPITIDHSAFDAYAFCIEADGLKAFHTGDFRTHGFRSGNFPKLIETYIGHVDYVVCEATNVSRPDATCKTEQELQKEYEQSFVENKYNIVYLSSTNIDRLFGLYHAALRAGRPFYIDAYQKRIMDIVLRDCLWSKSTLYRYGKYKPIVLIRDGDEFLTKDEFKDFLKSKGYVLVARANARYDNLIAQLPGELKKRYLSMWDGYVNPKNAAYNEALAKSLAPGFHYMHTSGHCDMQSLEQLFAQIHPKAIIPIHTDNPMAFAEIFSKKRTIIAQ